MLTLYLIFSFILAGIIFFRKREKVSYILFSLFLILQVSFTFYTCFHRGEEDSLYFTFDSLGIVLNCVLTLLSLATAYHGYLHVKRNNDDGRKIAIYHAALIGLIVSMTGAYFARHVAVMWVFIEATTLFVSALIYHNRTAYALEAAWKYTFICSIGVALAFMGILTLSMALQGQGSMELTFASFKEGARQLDPLWLKISFLLIFTGFSAKMGLFPFYTVCIDAHTAAPAPISAFISTALMNVGFLGIFRIYQIVARTTIFEWATHVLLISGFLSIFIAAIYLLKVKNFKRMFAYSSLENMGIIALSLACGSIGLFAGTMHLVFHSLAKASLFYQVGQFYSLTHTYEIEGSRDYFKQNPRGGLALIFGLLSIMAIPPSGLFISKFLVIQSLFLYHYVWIAVILLCLIIIIFFAFTKNIIYLLFLPTEKKDPASSVKMNPWETYSQFILLTLVIILGFFPPPFFTAILEAVIREF